MATSHDELLAFLDRLLETASSLIQRSEVIYNACVGFPPTSYGKFNVKRCKDDIDSFNEACALVYANPSFSKNDMSSITTRHIAVRRVRLDSVKAEVLESVTRLVNLTERNGVLIDPILACSFAKPALQNKRYC